MILSRLQVGREREDREVFFDKGDYYIIIYRLYPPLPPLPPSLISRARRRKFSHIYIQNICVYDFYVQTEGGEGREGGKALMMSEKFLPQVQSRGSFLPQVPKLEASI